MNLLLGVSVFIFGNKRVVTGVAEANVDERELEYFFLSVLRQNLVITASYKCASFIQPINDCLNNCNLCDG